MRGIQSHRKEEGFVPFLAQLIDRPLGPHAVCQLIRAFIRDRSELHEPAVGLGGSRYPLVGPVWARTGEGNFVGPGIHGVSGLTLTLGADVKVIPATQVDRTGGVMEELPRSHGAVAGFLEAPLE